MPYNIGAPMGSDVIEFMRGQGFGLIDFNSGLRTSRFVVQADLLFVPINSANYVTAVAWVKQFGAS